MKLTKHLETQGKLCFTKIFKNTILFLFKETSKCQGFSNVCAEIELTCDSKKTIHESINLR